MARGTEPVKRGDSWTAVVDIGPDPVTGKRRRKRVTARTKREVEQQIARLLAEAGKGPLAVSATTTVRDYLARWLDDAGTRLRPSSLRRYQDAIRLYVTPHIGAIPLARLTAADLNRLYAAALDAGRAPATIRLVHNVLHTALSDAVRWDLLARNVADAATPPRKPEPRWTVWDAAQVQAFLAAAADDDLEALWRLAVLTGMRRGELLGLRWEDVDLEHGALFVRQTLVRGAGSRLQRGEPKTAASRRRIALPPSAVASLRRHRARQLAHILAVRPAYDDQGLVFATPLGAPIHPNTLYARFAALIAKAKLPPIRFHDLRHTHASLLLAAGVHPKIVQERLGHGSIALTLDLYSHVSADLQERAAQALDAALGTTTAPEREYPGEKGERTGTFSS